MKFILIALFALSFTCSAQDFKSQIASFRQKYESDFLTDRSSPLKQADLQYLRYYNADSTYRVVAAVELLPANTTFIIPAFTGGGSEYAKYAIVKFTLNGKPQQLTIYRSTALAKLPQFKDYLFLPFTDDTNGKETYAGGRYIDMSATDFKDNTVVIDFNKAYNPYCAFSAGYTCPKPPDENRLAIAVKAGEMMFARPVAH